MEDLRRASQSYYNDERFTDFTIVCAGTGKEYKVHRCFVAAHSKYFETVFSASFAEKDKAKVVLKEDLPEAVDCMMQYFYQFEYDYALLADKAPTCAAGSSKDNASEKADGLHTEQHETITGETNGNGQTACQPDIYSRQPVYPIQLHAWVYAVADKYDVPTLKELALVKFRKAAASCIQSNDGISPMFAAASTICDHVTLREDDRALYDTLLDAWVLSSAKLRDNNELPIFLARVPVFGLDYTLKLMNGFKQNKVWVSCSKCNKKVQISADGENGLPQSRVETYPNGLGPGTWGPATFGKHKCTGDVTSIKDEVEVLSAVKIGKFW